MADSTSEREPIEELAESFLARVRAGERPSLTELAAARPELADLTMAATFRVAQLLQGQGKYDEAIAAYRGYLAKFPDGPQSADAQRAILDAQWQAAADLYNRKQYEKARAAWRAFAAANPLDGRVPQALFLVGEASAAEEKFDDAVAANDYRAALRLYNCKGVIAFVAASFDIKKDVYCRMVLHFIKTEPEGAVAKAMRKAIDGTPDPVVISPPVIVTDSLGANKSAV